MGLVWWQRSSLYLAGVAGLVLATMAFTAAYIAPYWLQQDGDQTLSRPGLHIGIWFQCRRSDGDCQSHNFSADDEYLKATRILQTFGFVGLLVSVITAIFINCRRHRLRHSFYLELVIAFAGLLGFSGCMVYLSGTREDVEDSTFLRYHWAFGLSVAASILALVSAVLILIANILSRPSDVKRQGMPGLSEQAKTGIGNVGHGAVNSPPRDHHPHVPAPVYAGNRNIHRPITDVRSTPHQLRVDPDYGGYAAAAMHGTRRAQQDSDWYRRQREEERYARSQLEAVGLPVYGQRPVYPVLPPTSGMATSTLPRVVVRGFYEPGMGYPEYVLM